MRVLVLLPLLLACVSSRAQLGGLIGGFLNHVGNTAKRFGVSASASSSAAAAGGGAAAASSSAAAAGGGSAAGAGGFSLAGPFGGALSFSGSLAGGR